MNLKKHLWLFISIAFSCALLLIRVMASNTLTYAFLVWNLFLAWIPFMLSEYLSNHVVKKTKGLILLFSWLIFFPNAPYIITDLFHFRARNPVPLYFDLILCFSFTWNGLLLGILSLINIENWVSNKWETKTTLLLTTLSLVLCGFGIYIGRYLRWNSWDLVTSPLDLLNEIFIRIINPFEHLRTWAVTILFASMLGIIYFGLKKIIKDYLVKQPTS